MDIKRNNKCLLTPDKCPRLSCAKHFDGRKFLIAYDTKIFSSTESFFIELECLMIYYILCVYLYFKKNCSNNFMQGRLLISRSFVSLIGLCNMHSFKVNLSNFIQLWNKYWKGSIILLSSNCSIWYLFVVFSNFILRKKKVLFLISRSRSKDKMNSRKNSLSKF